MVKVLLHIIFASFLSVNAAEQQSCERELEDFARMHIAIEHHPTLAISAATETSIIGAQSGSIVVDKKWRALTRSIQIGTKIFNPKMSFDKLLFRTDQVFKNNFMNATTHLGKRKAVTKLLKNGGLVPKNINHTFFIVRALQLYYEAELVKNKKKYDLQAIKLSEKIKYEKIKPFKIKVINNRNYINLVKPKLNTAYKTRVKLAGGLTGGILGLAVGLAIKKDALEEACSDYNIGALVGYFKTSLSDAMNGKKGCFLSQRGAVTLLNGGGETKRLCKNYPKIVEAVRNSFIETSSKLVKSIDNSVKKDNDIDIKCPTENEKGGLSFNNQKAIFKIKFDRENAYFEFQKDEKNKKTLKGGGKVSFSNGFPSFENTEHFRLRNGMGSKINYKNLLHNYLNKLGPPNDPTLSRKYYTGVALNAASLYKDIYFNKCFNNQENSNNSIQNSSSK